MEPGVEEAIFTAHQEAAMDGGEHVTYSVGRGWERPCHAVGKAVSCSRASAFSSMAREAEQLCPHGPLCTQLSLS